MSLYNVIEKREKLETFIEENGLTFRMGCRNQDSVILSGFALYIGYSNSNSVIAIVESTCASAFDGYKAELRRVFEYARTNNYGSWWETDEASDSYTF